MQLLSRTEKSTLYKSLEVLIARTISLCLYLCIAIKRAKCHAKVYFRSAETQQIGRYLLLFLGGNHRSNSVSDKSQKGKCCASEEMGNRSLERNAVAEENHPKWHLHRHNLDHCSPIPIPQKDHKSVIRKKLSNHSQIWEK